MPPELKKALEHFIADVMEPQIKKVSDKMQEEGIHHAQIAADPPKGEPTLIPPGAQITDDLVSLMIVVKVQGMLELSFQGMRFSFRSDLSLLFSQFHAQVAAQGYPMREMMLKRGWLEPPGLRPEQDGTQLSTAGPRKGEGQQGTPCCPFLRYFHSCRALTSSTSPPLMLESTSSG